MKLITLYKALLFWVIVGKNASVLCAGETANQASKTAGEGGNPAEGAAKASGYKRTAIILDINVKSSNQYTYTKGGGGEKFTVHQGFMIKEVRKGGETIWTPKSANKFGKEVFINLSTRNIRVTYL